MAAVRPRSTEARERRPRPRRPLLIGDCVPIETGSAKNQARFNLRWSGPFAFRLRFDLEVKLQTKLNQPRPTVGDNLSECGTEISHIVHAQELHMVECIKKFRAEFDGLVFPEGGFLCEGDIPIVDAGPPQEIARHVSVGEQRNSRLVSGIGARRIVIGAGVANQIGGIEPEIPGFRSGTGSVALASEGLIRISGLMRVRNGAHDVGTVQVVILLTGIRIRVNRKRLAHLECSNRVELPPFRDFTDQPVARMASERQLPNPAENEALRDVEVRDGAVEAVIVGIRISRGTRAETGSEINCLAPSVRGAKR